MTRWIAAFLLVPAFAFAQEMTTIQVPVSAVALSEHSVEAIAQRLAVVVQSQAATLTEAPDVWDSAADHLLITGLYALSAFIVFLFVGAFILGLAHIGGLRSLAEVRDAVDEWREYVEKAPVLAGLILVAGSIVAGSIIFSIFFYLASVATPYG